MDTAQSLIQKKQVTLANGTEIHYLMAGGAQGAPVVLLHGGGTDHAMLSWRDTLPVLVNAGYRVFAPNYPGYGDSPFGNKPVLISDLVDILGQLMDHWELQQAALVGVSLGGSVALGYALQRQERVGRMILIAPYGIMDRVAFHPLSYLMVRIPGLMSAAWTLARGSRTAARYSLNSIVYNPESRTEALLEEVVEAMRTTRSNEAFAQVQRDEVLWKGLKTDYTARLPEITVPVLLVQGTRDIGVPLKYVRRAAAGLPNARLEVIENAGHWVQRDYPKVFNRLMLEFLAGWSTEGRAA